jgi:hypothetical protein
MSALPMLACAQDKVVYHFSDTASQALAGLRSIKNHLDTDPGAKITAVALGDGIDFLLFDAKDRNGNPYEVAVQELASRGVTFEVCEITVAGRGLKKDQFLEEVKFTPSGVVRLSKLQHQRFAYIRP